MTSVLYCTVLYCTVLYVSTLSRQTTVLQYSSSHPSFVSLYDCKKTEAALLGLVQVYPKIFQHDARDEVAARQLVQLMEQLAPVPPSVVSQQQQHARESHC